MLRERSTPAGERRTPAFSAGEIAARRVFGDGKAALRDAVDADILDLVTRPEEFAPADRDRHR
jgi:hypothetical protein